MVGWAAGSAFEEVGGEEDGGGAGLKLPGSTQGLRAEAASRLGERHPWAGQESRPGQSPP